MKKFIFKIFIFFVPVLVVAVALEITIRNIPNDYRLKNDYLEKNAEKIEVLVLGSSHAVRGINPAFFDSRCFNAAYVSQTLDIDYKIIEKFGPRLKNLEYVVLSVSYFSLFTQLKYSQEEWRLKNYFIYYGINSGSDLLDYSEILATSPKISLDKLFKYYFLEEKIITCDSLGFAERKSRSPQNFNEAGKTIAKRHTKNFDLLESNIDYLEMIVDFCNQNGVKLFLYMPPAHISYREHLDGRQLKKTIEVLEGLSDFKKGVVFMNYLSDENFGNDDFFDPDHLNAIGAEKLSGMINEELKKMGNK